MQNHYKMKELSPEQRPYEKCLHSGPETLTDRELLAVILRSGTKGISSLELADDILSSVHGTSGLLGIHHLSVSELMEMKGIGQVKAIQIKCIGELSKRISMLSARKMLDFQDPQTIADYYMEQMRHCEQEEMICMMLNTKNQLIGEQLISLGTVNASLVSPRDLILAAFRYHAVYIILVHNHPSGNPNPSQEDILLTQRMSQSCSLVDIPLLDHIIIGDRKYISFRQEKIAPFL